MPVITTRPVANSQKVQVRKRPIAAIAPPSAVIMAPDMKPGRRPKTRISIAAGSAPSATPTLKPVTGAVASDVSAPFNCSR
jgi:hypothetical protein